jgi:hypothetical protein
MWKQEVQQQYGQEEQKESNGVKEHGLLDY